MDTNAHTLAPTCCLRNCSTTGRGKLFWVQAKHLFEITNNIQQPIQMLVALRQLYRVAVGIIDVCCIQTDSNWLALNPKLGDPMKPNNTLQGVCSEATTRLQWGYKSFVVALQLICSHATSLLQWQYKGSCTPNIGKNKAQFRQKMLSIH